MKRSRTTGSSIFDISRLPPGNPAALRQRTQSLLERLLDDGFLYSLPLEAHASCVNAIEFSPDGRWLASAGDDSEILVYDLQSDLAKPEDRQPSARFEGHRRNIFALAFDCTSSHIYSGGVDSLVLRYDLSRMKQVDGSKQHVEVERQDRRISCHDVGSGLTYALPSVVQSPPSMMREAGN